MRIALVAHDAKKAEFVDWVDRHKDILSRHKLMATGTTGKQIQERCRDLDVELLKSGPLGGDQQIGARIAEGELDALIFFIDPLSALPHDVDVKALLRLSTLYDVPMACSRSTAEFIITNPRFSSPEA